VSGSARPGLLIGVAAGIVGTAGYTALSTALKRRGTQPAAVAAALTGAPDAGRRRTLNTVLHWGYGVSGGLTRIGLVRAGLSGWRLDLAHLAAIWLPWRVLLAASGAGKPRDAGELAVDAGKHLVYVLGAGATQRLLTQRAVTNTRGGTRW
jgi:hypothetical protein